VGGIQSYEKEVYIILYYISPMNLTYYGAVYVDRKRELTAGEPA
jgi:hypothetical protein